MCCVVPFRGGLFLGRLVETVSRRCFDEGVLEGHFFQQAAYSFVYESFFVSWTSIHINFFPSFGVPSTRI